MKKEKIKVIGCGVSGLTVGVVLLDSGYDVEIFTEKLPGETTSAKAAAIWFPYEVHPRDKVKSWSQYSYQKFKDLSRNPDTGVSMQSLTVLIKKEEDAWWKNALPQNEIRKALPRELPSGYQFAYVLNIPLVETPIYLNYLLHRFQKLKGKVTRKRIQTLSELATHNEWIVNCTGLASRELANDAELYPIHGQIVKVEPVPGIHPIMGDFTFDEEGHEMAYVIPRKDGLILGGTTIRNDVNTNPSDEITSGILSRCKSIVPNLSDIKIISMAVGLRPGRSEIRLEREGNVIHNYGHGGGGFTVSWGCARSVLELVKAL